jgi:RNA polymerase-binding transcription factor DksA
MQEHEAAARSADQVAADQVAADQVAADLATLADAEAEFAAVDSALRRLDDGSYWRCEGCGRDIGALVAAAPLRRRCATCAPDLSGGGNETGAVDDDGEDGAEP